MDESVETTCSRCGAEIVVMTAGEYLSISDAELDFTLHGHGDRRFAIKSEEGSFNCPFCGKHDRLTPPRTSP